MAKRAKRANRTNPREERNFPENANKNLNIIKLDFPTKTLRKKIEIIPRSLGQEILLDSLEEKSYDIIFAMGPAGTGKTLLVTLYAIKMLKEGEIDKIIITRPAVSVDEKHGFLPGSLIDKLEPWVMPVLDVFKEYYHPKEIAYMMENGIIEISPLAYMRGRTFKNAFVVLDEAQNCTPSQMKMVLTRIGENSRIAVTGDLEQHDRGFEVNGLKDFTELLKRTNSSRISVVQLTNKDVERHPVINDILKIYNNSNI